MTVVLIAIACGLVAVLYGIITSVQVLRASPGNERMIAVAEAIQEGAKAYLGRQYTHDRRRRRRRRGARRLFPRDAPRRSAS